MNQKKLQLRKTAAALSVALMALCPQAHAGDPIKRLLDLQLKKGIITQQEYDELMAEMAAPEPKPATETAEIKEFIKAQDDSKVVKFIEKHEKDGSVKPSGLGWTSADGKNEVNLTGRVHMDARVMNNSGFGDSLDRDAGSMSDRFTLRRARIGVNGVLNKDIGYEVQLNGVGSSANVVDTAFANYKLNPALQFRMGRFNQPFALETQTSANNIDFMERSYVHQLAPFKQLGAMVHGESGIFNYAISGYQRDFDPQNNYLGLGPEAAARITTNLAAAFSNAGKAVVHLGLAGTAGRQTVTPTTSAQTGSGTETRAVVLAFNDENLGINNVYRNRIYGAPPCGTNTGLPNGCASATGVSLPASEVAKIDRSMAGLELAVAYGPAKFQVEAAQTHLSASSNANANASPYTAYTTSMSGTAKAAYAEFIYNLTGESWVDAYKSGVFSAVKPNSPYSFTTGSGTGAWQLALRYSMYDASDFGAVANTAICPDGVVSTTAGCAVDGSVYGTSSQRQYQLQGSPKGNTITLGLNWLLNPNARLMFNYARTNFDQSFLPVDVGTRSSLSKAGNSLDVFSVRSQFNF